MVGHVGEAPRTHIRSEIVTAGEGYRLVRVLIPAGESLPNHAAPDVAIICLRGEGRISFQSGREFPAEPGAIISIPNREEHAVYADQDLEIVLVQV